MVKIRLQALVLSHAEQSLDPGQIPTLLVRCESVHCDPPRAYRDAVLCRHILQGVCRVQDSTSDYGGEYEDH